MDFGDGGVLAWQRAEVDASRTLGAVAKDCVLILACMIAARVAAGEGSHLSEMTAIHQLGRTDRALWWPKRLHMNLQGNQHERRVLYAVPGVNVGIYGERAVVRVTARNWVSLPVVVAMRTLGAERYYSWRGWLLPAVVKVDVASCQGDVVTQSRLERV